MSSREIVHSEILSKSKCYLKTLQVTVTSIAAIEIKLETVFTSEFDEIITENEKVGTD